jgi:anti-sigma regulatory factor (Ser/Thr protein kinase)
VESAVRLLVSELVTNVVRHAVTQGELVISRHVDGIVLEVRDGREALPRWRRAEPDDEGGRGMFLVDQLAAEWGVRALPEGGKAVWCRLLRR